jgi:hypothetical protein
MYNRINLDPNTPRTCRNNCSVFTYPWKWNTWTGFWRNIAQFFDNLSAAWQRATKGHCTGDLWNYDVFLADYLVNTLTAFRNTTQSWNDNEFDSFEEYIDYIDDIIDELEYARQDPDNINPYYADWMEISQRNIPYAEWTEEDKAIIRKYNEEERHIYLAQKAAMQRALAKLSEHIDTMWI